MSEHYKGETGCSTRIERMNKKQRQQYRKWKKENAYKPLKGADFASGGQILRVHKAK